MFYNLNERKVAQLCLTLCKPMEQSLQAPLSKEFSRPKNWSGVPFPSLGDLPDPEIEHCRQILDHLSHDANLKKNVEM